MNPRKPRLVQVITRLIVGGAQLSVLGLCEALRDEYTITIICGPQSGPEGSLHRAAAELAPVHIVPALRRELHPRWDAVAVPAIRRALRGLAPDIVHTHSSKAGIIGRIAAGPLPSARVHTVHGWGHTPADPAWRRRVFIGLERAAGRRCEALIAVSDDNRREGLALGIGRPELYHVLPEVVDLAPTEPDFARARAAARAELGVSADAEVIGWIGRFVDQKDPDTLTSVLASVLRRRERTVAVLVGNGPRQAEVRARLDGAQLGARVRFVGIVSGARRVIPAFDVVVHPSRWEGQPRVIQEALAERVPVVASVASGVRELIRDGSTGYAVAPGAVAEMAERVEAVLETPALRAPLDSERLAYLRQMSGQEAAIEGHRRLYERLLTEGRRG